MPLPACSKPCCPKEAIEKLAVRSAWAYVLTDELAGDAIGLEPIGDRYLIAYVIDVSGHGVPAALLSVTAMHALTPAGEGRSLFLGPVNGDGLRPHSIARATVTELNCRRRQRQRRGASSPWCF